jgi:hypothetical protein
MSNFPDDYPDEYKRDIKISDLTEDIVAHGKTFVGAAQPGYRVLNFPLNDNGIQNINIGKVKKLPEGIVTIQGRHTLNSCEMNAAMEYVKNNTDNLNPLMNLKEDLNYKFTDLKGPQSGLYSEIVVPEKQSTLIEVELSGLLLPKQGGKVTKIEFDVSKAAIGAKTFRVWFGIKPNVCTDENAFIYYKNGVVDTTPKNHNNTILVFKNMYLPIVIKYTPDVVGQIRFSTGAEIPILLKTDTGIINYSLFPMPATGGFGSPVYYNFTDNDKKCAIYTKTANTSLLEDSTNYGDVNVQEVMPPIKLFKTGSETVQFIGLNEQGTLTVYYTDLEPTVTTGVQPSVVPSVTTTGAPTNDPTAPAVVPTLKTMPLDFDGKGMRIEAINRDSNGNNKIASYKLVLDDNINPMKDNRRRVIFPMIAPLNRTTLMTNRDWERTTDKYLEAIDNSGQRDHLGKLVPAMQITMSRPLFSKNYKLKMAIELIENKPYLKIYSSTKNNNNLFSVRGDPLMDNTFVADENQGITALHLIKNEFSKKQGWHGYGSHGPDPDRKKYEISERKYAGECGRKATAKSHYFVVSENNKKYCYIPTTEQSMKGYEFIPNSKSSLYVPSKFVTSGNVSDDTKLGIDKYKNVINAYAEKDYSNFNMMKEPWNPSKSLPKQVGVFNSADNIVRNVVGLKSSDSSKDTATIMVEGFQTRTLQQRTLDQINNYTLPKMDSYLAKQTKVNQNVMDISGNVKSINDRYAFMSDKVAMTNGVENNEFYDFTGPVIYSLKEDRSLVPALLKDQQTMVVEHNNLFIISTITVATLLISAIFVSSN